MSKARAAAWAGLAAIAAAVLACGFVQWPVSDALVRDSLNAPTGPDSTLRWARPDAATFRALPWPSLHFYNARLDNADGGILSAPEAKLDLSLGELLMGRITPARAIIIRPIVVIDVSALHLAGESLARLISARRQLAPLTEMSLVDGVVRILDRDHGFDTVIEDVRGRIAGIGTADTLRANLSAVWRGTPLTFSGSLASLGAGADGLNALAIGLKSSLIDLAVAGGVAFAREPSVGGDLALSVHSLSGLYRAFGLPPPALPASDEFAVAGKLKATADDLTLGDATITSAGQTFQGAMRISEIRGRASVSGTLDSEELAVEPLFGSPQPLLGQDGRWSRRLFAISAPRDFDLDLRLSAGALDLYGRKLTNAAASVLLKRDELTLSLIEATGYGGKVEGEARLSRTAGALDLRARAELTDADLGAALSDIVLPIASGRGNAEFAIATHGRTVADVVSHLNGTASLVLKEGSLAGINLEEALRRSQRRQADLSRDVGVGETAFDRLALSALVGDGVVHISEGLLEARGLSAALKGSVDLPLQTFNLAVDATQTDASGQASKDAAQLNLTLSGPWNTPVLRLSAPDNEKPHPPKE